MSFDFRPNQGALGDIMEGSKVRGLVEDLASRGAEAARSSAPRETGEYQDGISDEVVRTDRWVGRIVGRAGHTLVVEANTGNLQRALRGL